MRSPLAPVLILLAVAAPTLGQASKPVSSPQTFRLEDASGSPQRTFKARSDGYTVKDAKGKRLFRIKLNARRVKVRDAAGKELAYANTDGRKWKLKTPGTKATRFKLQPRPAGGFKLETATDVTVARISRPKSGGLRVKGKDGALLGNVKRGPKGRWELHGPQGKLLHRTAASIRPLALACLLLPKLSEAERLGLLALVQRTAPPPKPRKPTSQPTSKPSK